MCLTNLLYLPQVVRTMPLYAFGNFLIYCLINAFTPGPGNILALNTVSNYGWRKGKPLFFGIFAGYYAVQVICALFVYGVSTFLPGVMGVLQYIGAAYILYLAVHIVISRPSADRGEKSASFAKGFLLQFVNAKIYMFGITALTGFIVPFNASLIALLGAEIFIATVGTIATCTWIAGGLLIQKFYWKHYRIINIVLALTLLECAYSLLR